MIWLGRTDMAMVTFDEEQQPKFNRQGLDAAFLTNHLLTRSGAQTQWDRVDNVLVRLIGERDSMNPQDMTQVHGRHQRAHARGAGRRRPTRTVYKALLASPYGIQRIMSQIMYTDPTDAAGRAAARVPAARPALHPRLLRL
jgi:hypothetical protein